MTTNSLLLLPVLLGALAVPAQAGTPVKVTSVSLHGFPAGGPEEVHDDVSASFFLTKAVLGKDVKVTIGGRATTTRKVGKKSSKFYVARPPKRARFAWGRSYKVRFCIKGQACQTLLRKLPEQSL